MSTNAKTNVIALTVIVVALIALAGFLRWQGVDDADAVIAALVAGVATLGAVFGLAKGGTRPKLIIGLALTGLALVVAGCSSGQQGQGPTRAVNVQGIYAEHLDIAVAGTSDHPPIERLFDSFGDDSGGQDITLQPTAEGTADASQQGQLQGNVPISVGTGKGSEAGGATSGTSGAVSGPLGEVGGETSTEPD